MFDSKQGQIPGYTGHQQTLEEPDQYKTRGVPQKQIPGKLYHFSIFSQVTILGYAGYIKGVKSENVYGQTYGKTTYSSSAQAFHVGRDEPAHLKYTTTMKSEFINHSTVHHPTIAQTVGVERDDPRFTRVSFWFPLQVIAYSPCYHSQFLRSGSSSDWRSIRRHRTKWRSWSQQNSGRRRSSGCVLRNLRGKKGLEARNPYPRLQRR